MVPEISALATAMCRRNMRTRIVPVSRVCLLDTSTDDQEQPILYTWIITQLQIDIFQPHIPLFDLYMFNLYGNPGKLNHLKMHNLIKHAHNEWLERCLL